ncbi:DUF4148 domain-containing protein [Paraburkholderia sp. MMS20-SJTR3]|uniref:DUF4148 domain-containing protein n=1 Tax=Paraburkholderia sejongensis TaxID=2886946 RepID=A0ABS8K4D1_9BURK|nr:DUF4148 domain-containing protein [Paraburkholderia sp. MMS20-SJTR3]MCC8397022.1 DUF4148 domain-containing protein [Paraburkholderia sp. MMS20-SJTR3]
MNAKLVIAIVLAGASIQTAFADPSFAKTRAQVYQELIEAQKNGWTAAVSDASYPEVARIYEHQYRKTSEKTATAATAATSGEGPEARGTSQSGAPKSGMPKSGRAQIRTDDCVGPVSYCNVYFGS